MEDTALTGRSVLKPACELDKECCRIAVFTDVFASLTGVKPWTNIMEILEEKDGVDTELLVYAMTLVNKVG